MKNCQQVQNHLNALIDNELAPPLTKAINNHLSACSVCREQVESLVNLHNELLEVHHDRRDKASRFTERLLETIHDEAKGLAKHPPKQPLNNLHAPNFWQLAAALAAGFLIAVLIFQPWHDRSESIARSPSEPLPASYGNVSVSGTTLEVQTQFEHWTPCSLNSEVFPGMQLRTGSDLGAELQGPDSPALRMDKNSTISIQYDSSVELVSGRLWVSSQESRPAKVIADGNEMIINSGSLVVGRVARGIEVLAFQGDVILKVGDASQLVREGEAATVSADGSVSTSSLNDPILDTRWLHPILAQKKDDPELAVRVQRLLANLGRSKIEHLQVNEIRSLGHAATPPLIAFLDSADPQNQRTSQRRIAARLLADLASYNEVPNLINLLGDADQEVVQQVEKALIRITGRKPRPTKVKTHQPDREGWMKWLDSQQEDKA